ncbi:hypothetical protein C0Z16_00115 [Paraburkholderia rhynchosiae]|uniref:Uncharacterized protein n=1 Tax=Paraburkholderia rhynchosiae TaxID=487049 RepID=A0ABX4VBU5_9BURK|nr:hypothetical protein C0Z16_00115 [Paraburkholderia rhynchosiae]
MRFQGKALRRLFWFAVRFQAGSGAGAVNHADLPVSGSIRGASAAAPGSNPGFGASKVPRAERHL